MNHYEVTVDFGDNAVQAPRTCTNAVDLALYLERIPGMIGFEMQGKATITIKTLKRKASHVQAPHHVQESRG